MPEQIHSRGQLPNDLIGLAAIVAQAFDFVGPLVRQQAQMARVDRQVVTLPSWIPPGEAKPFKYGTSRYQGGLA